MGRSTGSGGAFGLGSINMKYRDGGIILCSRYHLPRWRKDPLTSTPFVNRDALASELPHPWYGGVGGLSPLSSSILQPLIRRIEPSGMATETVPVSSADGSTDTTH